jgi:hypothetical protein
MKALPVALTLSLAANLAAFGYFATRPEQPTAAPASKTAPATTLVTDNSEQIRTALVKGDLAALTAAGVPLTAARDLLLGRAMVRYAERMEGAVNAPADARWWRSRATPTGTDQALVAQRELNDAVRAALGKDVFPLGTDPSQWSFLPAAKRDALRRLQQDYDEMTAKFSAGGIQLASDKERLALLRAERDRDIAALLTPTELADYNLRTSNTSAALRAKFGDAIQSEEDFRKLYDLQKAFDDKFAVDPSAPRPSQDFIQQRAAAERQLQDAFRAALGEEKFAALQRTSDQELRALDALATRLNLPSGTTDRVAATREAIAAESQKISLDSSLPMTERRAKLQELASWARTELAQTLGSEAADAYAQRAAWLSLLQSGVAFATNPKDSPVQVGLGGSSVYPVLPTGVAGAMRQSMSVGSSNGFLSTPGAGNNAFIVSPGQGAAGSNAMQVISITTSSQSGTTTTTTTTSGTPPPRQ